MRRDFYIYFHRDRSGSIFYIGKGTRRRAWSTDRHPVWIKYVHERLNGLYDVEIYQDGLTESEAEELESSLIAECGKQLVNWINPARDFDYRALERYHQLRDANRRLVAETRPMEQQDLVRATSRYREALDAMRDYESSVTERGLIAELRGGLDRGDPNILDRLTLCLIKQGRVEEAIHEADRYFSEFPSAVELAIGNASRLESKSDAYDHNT